jgi:hypothetical protein
MKTAIKVQENLEKINENEKSIKWNTEKGFQNEWNDGHDRKIVFIPTEDFSGIGVYFYGDELNTARVGLSTRAALILSDGILKMFRENPEFLDKLKEETHAN